MPKCEHVARRTHLLTSLHMFVRVPRRSKDMRSRLTCAVVLLCAAAICTAEAKGCPVADLVRARQVVPRAAWKGHNFASMASTLTAQLSEGIAMR